ncbi:MAG: hypothetical protein ABH952_11135 [Candidatus Omnitrophota bacterium]
MVISIHNSKIVQIAKKLVKQEKTFDGFSIAAGATFVVQGADNANEDDLSDNGEDVTDVSYAVDF